MEKIELKQKKKIFYKKIPWDNPMGFLKVT
jgi:hypothetical protein